MPIDCTNDPNCSELDIETRKNLYGRKSTVREWITEIVRLKLGDPRRHQSPLNNEEVGQKLGITRQYVLEYIKTAIKHKLATAEIQIVKQDNQREIDQLRADIKDDLTEIRTDVHDIKQHILSKP